MIYIGIDPGKKGGTALIQDDYIKLYPMMEIKELYETFCSFCHHNDCFIALEIVHAMPKQGVVSMFNFGKHYGEIIGIITALGISYIGVAPQSWKKQILEGLDWKGNKKVSIEYIQKRFPHVSLLSTERSKIPSDGLADALCIALYAKRTYEGR